MWLFTFIPSACDVKGIRCLQQGPTLVQLLPICFYHILKHFQVMCSQCHNRSQPFAGSTPFAPADPVCRSISMVQENYHRAQLTGFDAIPDDELTSFNQSYSLLKAVFTRTKVLNMSGMRWSANFVICVSSFPKPTNLLQQSRGLMKVWIVILHDFHASAIGPIRQMWSAMINTQRGHICYWLCDFTTDKWIFNKLREHKECLLKI